MPHPLHRHLSPPPVRVKREIYFEVFCLSLLFLFSLLAVLAHYYPYFRLDLVITHALQQIHYPLFNLLMSSVSWIGYQPQIITIFIIFSLLLFLSGFIWEAVISSVGFITSSLIVTLLKLFIGRIRPSAGLIRVAIPLSSPAFPSAHVVIFLVYFGLLLFLTYTRLHKSYLRTGLISSLSLLIITVGPSRIYLGEHWTSDVIGSYLLGTFWLTLLIRLYRVGQSYLTASA